MDNDFATGYALGSDANNGNCNNGGFWGGDGWWAIIIFAMIFGWGRGGFGGFGGFGGASDSPGLQGLATRADVNEAIAFNGVERGIQGIQQGICDSTFALNNTMTNGFHGVDNAVCSLGYQTQSGFNALASQLASCCCDTQRAIDGVNYNLATQSCDTRNTIQNVTRDILENNNANTRAILDFLTTEKIDSLRTELSAAQAQLSQANQTNNLINALRPCPTPAYITCNPWASQAPYGSCGSYSGCGS